MTDLNLRSALRARTTQSHEELDRAVGHFADLATYGKFTRDTYLFRRAVEASFVTAPAGWEIDPIAALTAQDLADLELDVPSSTDVAPAITTPAQRLGVAYVLEGSSLGARMLVREALKLGLREDFGARHLARQAGDHERWRRFMAELDATSASHDEVIAAAEATFRFALSIYAKAAHERA
ncbi:heme oxygenase [Devosia sp. YR412]|uniref:biliverdin-producing heme oxygenase n=1 Tax=Devosia sp. YR412 TaxID=1881030 RepID=UPI0008CB35EB|nr:biliverdin-producing heme oxygenase [Devosia sp. YR412]SEQ02661.1 heme oxygenase [Devosia sp. YR412]